MTLPKTTLENAAKTCIAGRLRLVNRVVSGLYDDALRPLGLKISQGNILIVTARLGVAQPGQVCEMLQLDLSTLSRNVELMRKNGWIEDVPGDDARSRPFRLTDKGRTLIESALPAWEQAQEQARELLGDEFVRQLNRAALSVVRAGRK
jgi:DNA-binding MarR family transcriptional regulator